MTARFEPPPRDEADAEWQRARREAATTDQRAELNTTAVRQLVDGRARWFAVTAIAFSAAIALVFGWATYSLTLRVAAAEQSQQREQTETASALDSIRRTNADLAREGKPTVPVPDGSDPQAAVDSALLAQVLDRLPRQPTADEVAAVVGPAAVARITGPTAAQLTDQVASYFAANRTALRGEPGTPASAGQIRAAVDAALAANPPAPGRDGDRGDRGQRGETGPPGVSVLEQAFVRDTTGACTSRVRYSDGATTTTPAGDAACAPAEPSTPPTTEEGGTPTS